MKFKTYKNNIDKFEFFHDFVDKELEKLGFEFCYNESGYDPIYYKDKWFFKYEIKNLYYEIKNTENEFNLSGNVFCNKKFLNKWFEEIKLIIK